MTDPISNERLVGALDNLRVHQRQLDADGCEVGVSREALTEVICAFGELSRRQSPAGVEPVSDLIRQALHELDNVTALNDQDANCLGCAENLLRQALAPSPPKAVTITDDLLAALMEARDALNGAPNTVGLHHQIDAAITAALSSEAHNG